MPIATPTPRERRAQLRAAVLWAHPDHGGSTAALQEALRALRAADAPATPRPQATPRPRPAPRQYPPPPPFAHRAGPLETAGHFVATAIGAWLGVLAASTLILVPIWLLGLLFG